MSKARIFLLTLLVLAKSMSAQSSVGTLTRLGDYESRRALSYDRSGANADYRHLKPGETLELFAEAGPSVETPIGDFFGLGLGTYTVFHSALVAVAPDKALNAYFPMPLAGHGRITVTNEGKQEITDFYWNIDWVKLPSLAADTAYFHAQYRQCAPCQGWYHGNFTSNDFSEARRDPRWFNASGEGNYVFLETQGDGHFVGVTLSVFQNQWGGWNEGDEMIWIDGEPAPRIHGTGGPGQDRKMNRR